MRVLVFEFVTGGGYAGRDMVASLVTEGDLMLAAVVHDLLAIDGVEVSVCRDSRLNLPDLPIHVEWVDCDWQDAWRHCLHAVDAVLPIAPETGGTLAYLCREVEAAGKTLLNSRPQAVEIAASKLASYRYLLAAGIPVVDSWEADRVPEMGFETLVVKPDQGAGCQDIHLVAGERSLDDFLTRQTCRSDWLVQPYVPGVSASLSLLVGDDCVCLLGSNRQRIAQVNDGFVLLGCVVNGLMDHASLLLPLVQRLCRAIPGLWGYVGVDLIVTDNGPVVLEVNPRLTTSYVGLSRSLGRNVAELILRLAEDPRSLPARHLNGASVHVDLELGRVA